MDRPPFADACDDERGAFVRMKIAYVTTYDSSDVHKWSGTGSNILQTLQESGFKTETVGNPYEPTSYVIRGKSPIPDVTQKLSARSRANNPKKLRCAGRKGPRAA